MDDSDAYGTSRVSRLFPGGERLAHADLHNHTALSDGKGDPRRALASMRSAGLDAAALTDHAVLASGLGKLMALPLNRLTGIDRYSWDQLGRLADHAHQDGAFVAMRGFEWSDPFRGHLNVWGTEDYTDPLHDLGWGLGPLYDWLASTAGRQGLASFNHPGGRADAFVLSGFRLRPAARDQIVGLEVFNKSEDYVFRLSGPGRRSPLCRCLDAGWRPGLTGVTDEHGADWGRAPGKGRTGLWVSALTREGVRAALLGRRSYATRERGLRLDASLNGIRMGGAVPAGSDVAAGGAATAAGSDVPAGGAATAGGGAGVLRVDLAGVGPAELQVQLLGTGRRLPTLLLTAAISVPGPVVELSVPAALLEPGRHRWLVLRIADLRSDEPRAPGGWGRSVAYASPWWLE